MFSSHFNVGVVLTQVFQRQETRMINPHKLSVSAEILTRLLASENLYLFSHWWIKKIYWDSKANFHQDLQNFCEVKGVALIYSSSGIWLLAPVLIIQFWHKYFINLECSPATTFPFEVCGDYRWLARGRQIQSSNCQTKFSKRKLYTL